MTRAIDGNLLRGMLASGSRHVAREADRIDRMNVFPVPDGDTGSNLAATLQRMEAEVRALADGGAAAVANAAAKGALLGARGNSGVIFSQLLRGFADGAAGNDVLTADTLARAFVVSADRAFQAVIRPVEGTILTVAKDAASAAAMSALENTEIETVLTDTLDQARLTLARTPQMLDKLRLAGVVDAGGQGLVVFIEGMLAAVRGEVVEDTPVVLTTESTEALQWRYCTEAVVAADASHVADLRERLAPGNDSLLVVADTGALKIHVHTEDPAAALAIALGAGELIDVKIENMRRQHSERFVPTQQHQTAAHAIADDKPARFAAIAVVAGSGLQEIFRNLGATVVDGGQSMNPSSEDILRALNNTAAETVFLLPNNSNITASARMAAELSGRDARVVPTETIPQGIAALMEMEDSAEPDALFNRMTSAARRVVSAEVTRAVRDAQADGVFVREGDFIAILDGRIILSEPELSSALARIAATLDAREIEIVTLFFGAGLDEPAARAILNPIAAAHPDIEFQLRPGGQPHYHFLISAE